MPRGSTTSYLCVTSTGPPVLASGCTQPAMGVSGSICLPSSSHLGQSVGEVAGLPMQENHFNCSGVAQHALVLGYSIYIQPNPTVPVTSLDSALLCNYFCRKTPASRPATPGVQANSGGLQNKNISCIYRGLPSVSGFHCEDGLGPSL